MYFAPSACRRRNSSISESLIMSSVPSPPGTQITSSCGQSAKLIVGVSVSTESLATGSIRFQIRCTFAPGTLENTCKGDRGGRAASSWETVEAQSELEPTSKDALEGLRLLENPIRHGRAKRVLAPNDPAIH